ncbi:MAG TPA: hypothetical protein VNK95_12745, partial [Caldilineaceae bacterium]|nr:hypothetical protein [Caldilineaceae bacterium]
QETLIADQLRILENMEIEDDYPDADDDIGEEPRRVRVVQPARPSQSKHRVEKTNKFQGLVESDFKTNPAGTSWRARDSLGGLLAKRLHQLTGMPFESRPANRRCQVYVQELFRIKKDGAPPHTAKFTLWLDDTCAYHGFYIEKSHERLDITWDWTRFTLALATQGELWQQMMAAMREHNLQWQADIIDQATRQIVTTYYIRTTAEGLTLTEGDGAPKAIDQAGFAGWIDHLPADSWCDFYLYQRLSPQQAIGMRVGLADHVAKVWQALLPLYEASIRRGTPSGSASPSGR